MEVVTRVISAVIAVLMMFFGIIARPATETNQSIKGDKILFYSDFQGIDREPNFEAILSKVDFEPNLIISGGDHQTTMATGVVSDYGISIEKKLCSAKWPNATYIIGQGNHDPNNAKGLSKSGLYEFDKCFVYLINEDDFPWEENKTEGVEDIVKATAKSLEENLANIANKNANKLVFVVSHLPLHATTRTSGGDNLYAKYIFDAINKYGDKLDIIYLFGHNHSGAHDDYIGGTVVFLAKGNIIKLPKTNEECALNFTYTNCGYVGYSNNTNEGISTNVLTVSTFTVYDDRIELQRYSANGAYYESPLVIERNNSQSNLIAA